MKTRKHASALATAAFAMMAFAGFASTHVDLLVSYDTTSQDWLAANESDALAFAESQVAKANGVLANSGLSGDFDFRLAGVHLGTFTHNPANSMGVTLANAIGSEDAAWADLRDARNAVGADIVVVLVDTGRSSGMQGLSQSMSPIVNGERKFGLEFPQAARWLKEYMAENAYSVVNIGAAQSGFTFVHEVGHVMGAGHAGDLNPLYSEPGPQLYEYSTGVMMAGSDGNYYATVMGYNTTGYEGSERYTVLPYFSSPDVTNPETGEALGDARHDNVRTLRNTCAKVAAFRDEVAAPEPETPGTTPEPEDPGTEDPGTTPGTEEPGTEDPGTTPGTEDPGTTPEPEVTPDTPAVPHVAAGEFTEKKLFIDAAVTDGESIVGFAEFTVFATKKGESKVSATIIGLDGKKMKTKNAKYEVYRDEDGLSCVTLEDVAVKGFDGLLNATLRENGALSGGTLGGLSLVPGTKGIEAESASFCIAEPIENLMGGEVVQSVEYEGEVYNMLPYAATPENVTIGAKWTVAKGGRLKAKKDRLTGETALLPVGTGNFSALKLNYKAKDGTFKGSFTVYAIVDGRLKKFKFNVTGVTVDNTGVGIAVCKKTGTVVDVVIK